MRCISTAKCSYTFQPYSILTFNLTLPTNPSHYELIGAILSGISNVIFTKILNFDIIAFLSPLTGYYLVPVMECPAPPR